MAKKQPQTLTKKQIEDTYRSKTAIEHILTRSETYVGSKSPERVTCNVVDESGKLENRKITIIPAVVKLIDEVISNSVDEYRRNLSGESKSGVTEVTVHVRSTGHITITDNGGMPFDIHPKTGQRIPDFLFSDLYTSTNYDDTKKRNGTGTNGFGAKLTNIFSTRFTVTTTLTPKGNKYTKTWRDNRSVVDKDIIDKASGFKGTVIDFQLDLSKFSTDENQSEIFNDDTLCYFRRRCLDAAGANPGLKIKCIIDDWNYTWQFKDFRSYVSSIPGIKAELLRGESTDQWEIYYYPSSEKRNLHIGFVNGSECNIGRHFDVAVELGINSIAKLLRKHKIAELTELEFKNCCQLFINMVVPNPVYSNQTKEKLSTKAADLTLKGKPKISHDLVTQIQNSDLIELILDWKSKATAAGQRKANREVASEMAAKTKIANFVDANKKGNRMGCELWVFEGRSASSGFRSARNPETQGKFDLRGKVKNPFGLTLAQLYTDNKEYRDLAKAIGLPVDGEVDIKKLNFFKIIICTDMDVDGDSIAGMLFLFFQTFYPSLIKAGMVYRAIAPIISAESGTKIRLFNSVAEFDKAKLTGWNVRYLKGTGSMTPAEYTMMVQDSTLQRVVADTGAVEIMNDWFGDDSSARKKYFEADTNKQISKSRK